MTQQTATTILQYQVNASSVAQAVAANKSIAASYDNLAAAAATMSSDVLALNPQLATAATQTASATQQQATAVGALAQQYKAVKQAAEDARAAELLASEPSMDALTGGGGGGGRSLGQNVTRFGRALFNAPNIDLPGGISSTTVSRLAIGGGAAVDALGLSAAALGVAGVAAVGLGVAMVALTQDMEKGKEAAKATAAAFLDISQATHGKTIDELQQQRQDTIQTMNTQQRVVDNLQGQLDAFNQSASAAYGGAPGPFVDTTGQAQGLQEALNDANVALKKSQAEVNAWNIVLLDNATAADAAAAAEAARAKQQVSDADRAVEISKMTAAQRQEAADAENNEIYVLAQYRDSHHLAADAVDAINAKIIDLIVDYQNLTTTTNTYADALEAEKVAKEATTAVYDQYFDALEREGAARDKITALNGQLAEDYADYYQKYLDITADYETRRGEIISDGADRVQEIEDDAADRRAQIVQDNADAVAKIMRDAARSEADAVRNRNVDAYLSAAQKAKDDLSDQQKAEDKQLAQAQKAEDKQLAQQQKAQDKQLRSLEDSYEKQNRSIEDAYFKQKATIDKSLAQAQVDLTNAQAAERAMQVAGTNQVIQIHNQMYVDMAVAAFNGAYNIARNLYNGFAAAIPILPPITGTAAQQQATRQMVTSVLREVWAG